MKLGYKVYCSQKKSVTDSFFIRRFKNSNSTGQGYFNRDSDSGIRWFMGGVKGKRILNAYVGNEECVTQDVSPHDVCKTRRI